jgi:FKBP-type peptidyl-prolyl cis-trans isomerase SlyD
MNHPRQSSRAIVMKKAETIGANKVVTIQYSLTNDNGVVVREASSRPVSYLHGVGALFPRLERTLESHCIGDIVTVRLLPEDAFGKRDIELLHTIALDELPPGDTIEVGGHITGSDEHGNEITFAVTRIENGIASLDGNHPLAGQSLVFEIEIQCIRDASAELILEGKAGSEVAITSPSGNGYPGS